RIAARGRVAAVAAAARDEADDGEAEGAAGGGRHMREVDRVAVAAGAAVAALAALRGVARDQVIGQREAARVDVDATAGGVSAGATIAAGATGGMVRGR